MKDHNIKRDYIITFLVTLSVIGVTVIIYRLAQSRFGTRGFSEFSFAKRIIAFLAPVMAIGMGVGVPREVARVNGTESDEQKYEILRNSLFVTILLFALLFIIINALPAFLAGLLFGESKFHYLLNPIAVCLLGAMLNSLVYSYYRGLNSFLMANSVQFANLVLFPVLVIMLSSNIPTYLVIYGGVLSLTSLVFVTKHTLHGTGILINIPLLFSVTRYSIKRLPGDIALQLMFVIPPILTAHMLSFDAAGDISFTLTILTLITVPLSPVSVLMLPKAVTWMRDGRTDFLKKSTGNILFRVVIAALLITLLLFLGSQPALRYYLPERESLDILYMKAITAVILPYSVYIYLRSFIDAFHERSYNSINSLISLVVFLCLSGIFTHLISPRVGVASGLIGGFYVLGLLTSYRIYMDRLKLMEDKK